MWSWTRIFFIYNILFYRRWLEIRAAQYVGVEGYDLCVWVRVIIITVYILMCVHAEIDASYQFHFHTKKVLKKKKRSPLLTMAHDLHHQMLLAVGQFSSTWLFFDWWQWHLSCQNNNTQCHKWVIQNSLFGRWSYKYFFHLPNYPFRNSGDCTHLAKLQKSWSLSTNNNKISNALLPDALRSRWSCHCSDKVNFSWL